MRKYKDFPEGITIEMFQHSDKAIEHNVPNILPPHLYDNAKRFAWEVMKPIQDMFPGKCKWHSLFRCEAVNVLVGGTPTSEHKKACGGDLEVVGVAPNIVHAMLKGSKIQFSQVIRYEWGNHVGLNPNRLEQKNQYIVKD